MTSPSAQPDAPPPAPDEPVSPSGVSAPKSNVRWFVDWGCCSLNALGLLVLLGLIASIGVRSRGGREAG